jgi:uncharacterized protein (TIGR02246 family)
MRALIVILAALSSAVPAIAAAPLTKADRNQVARLPARFTDGWLHDSRAEVMGLFAPEAIFIPHDGVKPHVGKRAITEFWFPATGAGGKVTAFVMTAEGVSGEGDQALVWGKSDLDWQDKTTAYHWPGYYLMSARRRHGKWLVTHLMSSDEQPTSTPINP